MISDEKSVIRMEVGTSEHHKTLCRLSFVMQVKMDLMILLLTNTFLLLLRILKFMINMSKRSVTG